MPNVAGLEIVLLITERLGACAASNNDVMRIYLRERVVLACSNPKRRGLASYLEDTFKSEVATLKTRVQGKSIVHCMSKSTTTMGVLKRASCLLSFRLVGVICLWTLWTHLPETFQFG